MRLKRINKETDTVARFDLDTIQEGQYAVEIENRFAALSLEYEAKSPEEKWEEVKGVILDVAEQTVGRKRKVKKQKWMTMSTLDLVNKRREEKERHSAATENYKQLHSQVVTAIRKDKERHSATVRRVGKVCRCR